MIITTIEELRLAAPAHALDSIDGMVGFIDNSEHDFLEDKLGAPLYKALCEWYEENASSHSMVSDDQTGYYNRLLLMAQRCVAFDALGASAGMQIASVNNAGINRMSTDDYKSASKEEIDVYTQTCNKEAHKAVNLLLQTLEEWTKYASSSEEPDEEMSKIVELWKESRYFYLAASLLIPSATVLQTYFNFYENRERFIQMLPDLRYIQEEELVVKFGDDLIDFFIKKQQDGVDTTNRPVLRAMHYLRKAMAAGLESRTRVVRTDEARRKQAHDEMERHLSTATDYIIANADDIFGKDKPDSPIFPEPEPESVPCERTFQNNRRGNAIFVVPALD